MSKTNGNGPEQQTDQRRERVPQSARIVAAVAAVLLGVHMFFTAVVNTPSTEIKYQVLPGAAADQYARPYLVQDYRIFAPDPIDTDRQLWVRAWIERPDGERVRSEWVNASEVELSDKYRRTLRKQLSVVGAERLMGAYKKLTEDQRAVAEENHLGGDGLYALRDALLEADDSNPGAVRAFIRADNFVSSYATQVSLALWGDQGEVLAVQTRAVYDPVIRWKDRHDPQAQRPASSYTLLGWVPAMEWPGQDREAFAKSFNAWAEQAGVTPGLETSSPNDTSDEEVAP